ncbi:MAG: magnesium transporter [Candidatus Methylacidiphilales bacterium]
MAHIEHDQSQMITDDYIVTLTKGHPHDIARQIEHFEAVTIRKIFRGLPDELTAEVLAELPLEIQIELFESMRVNRLSGIISEMFTDDAADVLGSLSTERLREILTALPKEEASALQSLLNYPEDTAGGIMQREFIAVSDNLTLREAREQIRKEEESENEGILYVYVTDMIGRLRGILRIRDLLFRDPNRLVRDVMIKEVRCVSVHADQEEIAKLVQSYHFLAVPVVDDFGKLVGIVTHDDILEVIQEEATEDIQRLAGLSGEEVIDSSWKETVAARLPWLFVNLITAFLAASVVSIFEGTIAEFALLAVFMPIVAGQGGNSGTQTLTIVVRSLALGEIRLDQRSQLLIKELLVGLCNGCAIGISVGFITWLWKGNVLVGVIICLAMIFNMLAAAAAGVMVPLTLKSLKIDPALGSGIMVTTVTDVFGFFIFLGMATVALSIFPGLIF